MFVHNSGSIYANVDWEYNPNITGAFVTAHYEEGAVFLFTDSYLVFSWMSRYGKITNGRFLRLFNTKPACYRIPAFVLQVVLDALELPVERVDGEDIERDACARDGFPARMYNLFMERIRSGPCCGVSQSQLAELFGDNDRYGRCDAMALQNKAKDEIMAGNNLSPLMVWGGATIRAIDRLPFETENESASRISWCLTEKTTKERRREIFCPDPFSVCRNEFIAKMK